MHDISGLSLPCKITYLHLPEKEIYPSVHFFDDNLAGSTITTQENKTITLPDQDAFQDWFLEVTTWGGAYATSHDKMVCRPSSAVVVV